MNDYILSGCSTCDLTIERLQTLNIAYLCFHYELDDVSYPDDFGQTISFPDFYERMRKGSMTRTSQPNAEQYEAHFRPMLEAGRDILHVTLSSGISGAYNSANVAREKLLKEFPERKLLIVDSLGASSGYGLFLETLAKKRDEGASLEELYTWAEANRLRVHHWFFSTDLTFYVRGGRVSKTSGWFGTVLNICPLLNMDHLGRLIPRRKIRGKKGVIHAIVEEMKAHAENGFQYTGAINICNSDCPADAQAVAELVEQNFPNAGKPQIYSIGTTIGSHTGPGTVALFFWGDERKE